MWFTTAESLSAVLFCFGGGTSNTFAATKTWDFNVSLNQAWHWKLPFITLKMSLQVFSLFLLIWVLTFQSENTKQPIIIEDPLTFFINGQCQYSTGSGDRTLDLLIISLLNSTIYPLVTSRHFESLRGIWKEYTGIITYHLFIQPTNEGRI
jgi:hypothetical protein